MHFWLIDFSKMPFKRSHNGVFYNPTIRMRDGKVRYVPDKDGVFSDIYGLWLLEMTVILGQNGIFFDNSAFQTYYLFYFLFILASILFPVISLSSWNRFQLFLILFLFGII